MTAKQLPLPIPPKAKVVRPVVAEAHLLTAQQDGMELLATLSKAYTGVFTPDLHSAEEEYIDELAKTQLQTPLEFVNTVWLLTDVTRSFTHQLVRTRIGVSYVQQSLRFAEIEEGGGVSFLASREIPDSQLPEYVHACQTALDAYHHLVKMGSPRQAARGVLPHNVLTHVYWSVNLRTLSTVMRQRLCCQADRTEWVPLLLSMRKQLRAVYGPDVMQFLLSNVEKGEPCGYGASFDRPCEWVDSIPD